MKYTMQQKWIDQFEHASTNQHGDRYKKKVSQKIVKVVVITARFDNADELARLIYIGSKLDVPIHWDSTTSPQTAYIKLISAEAV